MNDDALEKEYADRVESLEELEQYIQEEIKLPRDSDDAFENLLMIRTLARTCKELTLEVFQLRKNNPPHSRWEGWDLENMKGGVRMTKISNMPSLKSKCTDSVCNDEPLDQSLTHSNS